MRIGLAQINTTVGDLDGNRARILAAYDALVARGAEVVVLPELCVCGYPARDLLLKRAFVPDTEASLARIAAATGRVPLLAGTVTPNHAEIGRPFRNTAALCQHGRVVQLAHKCLLPTYDIFDEDRYFEPAREPSLFFINERRVAITICEDIWAHPQSPGKKPYHLDPIERLAAQKPDLMLNLSASPWHNGKNTLRARYVSHAARRLACPVAYLNAVGANDEIIFDGRSLAAAPGGEITHALPAFAEALEIVDLPAGNVSGAPRQAAVATPAARQAADGTNANADLHAALTLGIRDYARKNGFKTALVALSGGIDSALVARLAVAALGAGNVTGVSLPSAISSQHSRDDALALARNLGIAFHTLPVEKIVAATEAALAPLHAGLPRDVTEENIQARARGLLMMALSNKTNALLLTTGNKSELAVGYCTLYGDMCGGFAPISDLYKTQVYDLARWINRDREIIPRNTLDKPPSAELRPGQTDQDNLPPYDALDPLLRAYIEDGRSRADLVAAGFDAQTVADITRKVDQSEYKRKQAPPGLKVTPLAFGIGRRLPITQKYKG